MERLLEELRKKHDKKKLTEKQVATAVLRNIKGDKEHKKNVFNRILVQLQIGAPPKEYFKYEKQNRKDYRIKEMKFGVVSYYTVSGIDAVRDKEKEWKERDIRVDTVEEHKPTIWKRPIKKDVVKDFYNSLAKHYYIVKDFTVKLYDGDGDHVFMLNDKEEEVESFSVVKFFITTKKIDLSDKYYIHYYAYKKIADDFYALLVLPKLYFRNSRVLFNKHLLIGREMSLAESIKYWKTAEKVYGYEETVIPIKAVRKKQLKNIDVTKLMAKKKEEEVRKEQKQLKQISKLDVNVVKSRKKAPKIVMRCKYSKNVNMSIENRFVGRVDRQLRREQRIREVNKVVDQYNGRNKDGT